LEGLEAVEVNFNELENEIRIDAELYEKQVVRFERKIKKMPHTTFEKEASLIKKGIFDIKSDTYSETGVPFVRISNLKDCGIETNDIIYIPLSENEKNLSTFLKRNDIILSKTANAAASIVDIDFCNTSQDTVAIKLKSNSQLNSHFIVAYLNTPLGNKQMQRWFTGNIQMHLNLTVCKEKMLLPVFSIAFQNKIKHLFDLRLSLKRESKNYYQQAETLLLIGIGLKDFKPSTDIVNIKSFKDSFESSGRLDAEFYQVKYDKLLNIIKAHVPFKFIKEIRTENFRGLQPFYEKDGELSIINSKHILETSLDYGNFEKTNPNNWDLQSRARVYKGDILTYTTGANIGRTQVYLTEERALASNHVNILRLKCENPYYVGFVLNSIVGRLQTEKYSAGSAQAELYPKDIDEFIIPLLNEEVQVRIIKMVEDSFRLKKQSEYLLEVAKKAVEMAIEEGEERAMEWVGANTQRVMEVNNE
jgi:restriction endonuclease S subunit